MKEIQIRPVERASAMDNGYGLDAKAGTRAAVEGQQVFFPAGCSRLHLQRRQGGDIYAELKTLDTLVAGTGPTAFDAINTALGKLAVAA